MSRVSNNPISVPANVQIESTPNAITVKGPLGLLIQKITSDVSFELNEMMVKVNATNSTKHANSMSGTLRAILANMITGVTRGFEKKLLLVGVGYRAQADSNKLNLTLGYSHPIEYKIPDGIKIETPSQTEIVIKGIDKQKVGQVSAEIRSFRLPEPYKGKGIRYSDELIQLKETKKK